MDGYYYYTEIAQHSVLFPLTVELCDSYSYLTGQASSFTDYQVVCDLYWK